MISAKLTELQQRWLFSRLAQDQLSKQGQMPGGREDNDSKHSFPTWSAHFTLYQKYEESNMRYSPNSCSSFHVLLWSRMLSL